MEKRRKRRKYPYMGLYILCSLILIVTLGGVIWVVQCYHDAGLSNKNQPKTEAVINTNETEEPAKELTKEEKIEIEIDRILKDMPLEEKVSQLFFVTPESLTGVEVAIQAGEATKEVLSNYPVGGIILFSQNILSEDQLKTMLANLQSYSKYPLFTGIDEEGGPLVARVANSGVIEVPALPNMVEIGNTNDPRNAYEAGVTLGSYLKELGFNVNFAPVADVATNPMNTVIGERSFGSDPNLVAQMVSEEVKGMQSQGVSATIKHFPGHGGTAQDSHAEMAVSYKTIGELHSTEFLPFKSGIEAGTDMVMVGHIAVPEVTGNNLPATFSEEIISECLRKELGYDGIVITDSMRMGAIINYYDAAQAAVDVLLAGGDMILMPQDFHASYQAILNAVENQVLTEERIDNSLRRIYRVKLKNM